MHQRPDAHRTAISVDLLERAARRNHLACHARDPRRLISTAALRRKRGQSAQKQQRFAINPVSMAGCAWLPKGCSRRSRRRQPQAAWPGTARLPVCRHLATTLEHARRQPGPIDALADAFVVIEPRLTWKVRAGAETLGEQSLDGHANATIMGPEGLEIRRDVWIGVSLMAPHTRYPDHRHPPEEIYVVLSDGQWRQASDPWHEPGIGGWYTMLRTSCTRCAQRNGPCWRCGSFGQNRSAPDLGGIGCDEAYIAR